LTDVFIKFLIVGLIAFGAAYISDVFSEPPSLAISNKYNEEYNKLTSKPLSSEEFAMLTKKGSKYVEELTNSENTNNSVRYIVARKIVIVPLISFLWIFVGWKIGFERVSHVGWAVLLIGGGSLFSVNILETFFYIASFIIGVFFIRNKARKIVI